MNKIILLLFIPFIFLNVRADNAKLFSYDEQKVSSELQQLNELENYVNRNEGVTLTELKASGHSLVKNVIYNPVINFGINDEPPLGIPSFLWGCCFGIVGILIVYLITENKEETKKALYGFLIVWGTFIVIYIILIAFSILTFGVFY